MSGTFINPTMVAKEALRHLKNNLVAARYVHRGYEEEWKQRPNGFKIGSAVNIKAPVYFRVKEQAALDAVNVVERDITLTVGTRGQVSWPITSQEMTLNIDRFSQRFLKPAMQALANKIDVNVLNTMYKNVPNQVGTPGTTPHTYYTFAQAQARMSEEACPDDDRFCLINPQTMAKMSDSMKNLFQNQMVTKAISKGKISDRFAGFKLFESNNLPVHTNGTWAAGTCLVDDTVSEGDADFKMDQNGAGSDYTLLAGDYFTVGSVNSVNPISGLSTGQSRGFVVTTNTTFADIGGGDMEVTPAIIPGTDPYFLRSGSSTEDYLPYQNLSALPGNNAVITVAGTTGQVYPINMAFHKDCLALAMVPLEMPLSAGWKAQESYDGLTIRVIRDYDITNDQEYIRFDVLYGMQVINPMLACRIAG